MANIRNEIVNEEDRIDVIKTPAFGRPFRLGMLYDRVHDKIIPGETLLTITDMENHTYTQEKKGCSFDVIYGDSLEDKSRVFKGDANLEINFLKGVAALGSSGKFLNNKILNKKELRVTLTAEYIRMYKELEMKHFESQFSNTTTNATHIVTAIEYGANVTFTFDRTISENEDALEISGELKGLIEKIPLMKVSGNIEGNMRNFDKTKTDKISCKFCGDVILKENPTTYEEAVQCYKELPSLITEDEPVPVTVWLYPIPNQSTPANNVLQTINEVKMKQAVIAFERLQRIDVLCNDLMSGYACTLIPEMQCKISRFRSTVQTFQEEFQDQISAELHGDEDLPEDKMSRWLVAIDNMKYWLSQNAELEIILLNTYINKIKKEKIEILPKSGVEAKLIEHDRVIILDVVLPFSSGEYVKEEPGTLSNCTTQQQQSSFTEKVFEMLKHRGHDTSTTSHPTNTEVKIWYEDKEIKAIVRKKIKRFLTLHTKFRDLDLEFFVTFTDRKDSELHDKITSCVRLLPYEDGEIDESNNLMSSESEEYLYTRTDN